MQSERQRTPKVVLRSHLERQDCHTTPLAPNPASTLSTGTPRTSGTPERTAGTPESARCARTRRRNARTRRRNARIWKVHKETPKSVRAKMKLRYYDRLAKWRQKQCLLQQEIQSCALQINATASGLRGNAKLRKPEEIHSNKFCLGNLNKTIVKDNVCP